MPHENHVQNPLTIEQIAEISEQIYSQLTDLICSLQVFKPLQDAALHNEQHESLEALSMLHRDLLQRTNELDQIAHNLRRAVDPDEFAKAYVKRALETLDTQNADTQAFRKKGRVQ